MVALFLGIGLSAFVYSKITRRTGGIAKSDITVSAIVGVLGFLVMLSVMSVLTSS